MAMAETTALRKLRHALEGFPGVSTRRRYHDVVDERRERLRHMHSGKGAAEVQEAIQKLSGGGAEQTEGAKTLARLAPVSAFGPLLAAAEAAKGQEVKLQFLQALRRITEQNQSESFVNGVERLVKIVRAEAGTFPIAKEAVAVISYCWKGPEQNTRVSGALRELRGWAGFQTPLGREISDALRALDGI